MNDPWFDPNLYAWIPGTLLGVLGGLWGSLVGILAPRGKAKPFVLGSLAIMLAACAACLTLGVFALLKHQPYGVWYGLIFPGVLGLILFPSLTPVVLMRYREAENRKMQARDL
jgi:peptidoglycan/LPS O-acetylase OafA/YrhL